MENVVENVVLANVVLANVIITQLFISSIYFFAQMAQTGAPRVYARFVATLK